MQWKTFKYLQSNKMDENQNKIFTKRNSIEKDKLFALWWKTRETAKIVMTWILTRTLRVPPRDAYQKILQLKQEREIFYSL